MPFNYQGSVTTTNNIGAPANHHVWQNPPSTISQPHITGVNWSTEKFELPAIDGLDELCEMLGVEEGGQAPLLSGLSGKRFSLVNILRAQMELMVRLNILLVHREIIPEAE